MSVLHCVVFVFLCGVPMVTGCYYNCIQNFTKDMEKISQNSQNVTKEMEKITPVSNGNSALTADFCRAMSSQIQCLQVAIETCPLQQKSLVENLLSFFIEPDYHRTCSGNATSGGNGTDDTNSTTTFTLSGNGLRSTIMAPAWGSSYPGINPTTGLTLMVCRQKIHNCQNSFNGTFSSNMPQFNISGLCQSLKQYTICFINLLSSECGHLVPRNLVYNMQNHYGGMCSNDAQANTYTMMKCANLTMKCYIEFNSSLPASPSEYNIVRMCSVMDNYSACMDNVSQTQGCAEFTKQSQAGLQHFMRKHNAYCGNDTGLTSSQCVQSFQECSSPFNDTFFPALHTANLTAICSSLNTYASCVSRLSATCSQQFGQMLQSVQTLKAQFAHKCQPDIIKLTSCQQVGKCSQEFWANYSSGKPSNAGLCESIGDYFPCIQRSLDTCQLPQSTTDIDFGDLGALMKGYCEKLSSNQTFTRCPAFFKCTAATWVSFSPTIMNLFEGSTWCTFLQLSIGCAEQAVQSSACFSQENAQLRLDVWNLDQQRIQTCETGKDGGKKDNLVDSRHQKMAAKKGGGGRSNTPSTSSRCLLTVPLLVLLAAVGLTSNVLL